MTFSLVVALLRIPKSDEYEMMMKHQSHGMPLVDNNAFSGSILI